MNKDIKTLETILHSRYLCALNLYRFIQAPAFQEAWNVSTDSEKKAANEMIEREQQASLIIWTKVQLRKYLLYEVLDVRYLRELAQDYGIKNYSILTRLELIDKLRRLENGNGSDIKGNDNKGKDQESAQRNDGTACRVRKNEGGSIQQTSQISRQSK